MNNSVFKRHRKIVSDGDDVTSYERLFHTPTAATGKALSPIVECYVHGTTRCRSRCRSLLWLNVSHMFFSKVRRRRSVLTSVHYSYASRNMIRSGTRSQCKSRWSEVTGSYLRGPRPPTPQHSEPTAVFPNSDRLKGMQASVAPP